MIQLNSLTLDEKILIDGFRAASPDIKNILINISLMTIQSAKESARAKLSLVVSDSAKTST